MTNTQAELRDRLTGIMRAVMFAADMEDRSEEGDARIAEAAANHALSLLPPAPAVGEALEECKGLLRVMIERDPHETITDPDAGQWKMIDEWRHRARKSLAALGEGGGRDYG